MTKTNLKIMTEEQLSARDTIASYLRNRLDFIVGTKIDSLIKNLKSGEAEPVDMIKWEWTVVIEGPELDIIKSLSKVMRGESYDGK